MSRLILLILCFLSLGGLVTCAQGERADSTISQKELLQRIESESDILILDVRTPEEFYSGHVPGAINISHTDLPKRIEEVYPYKDKDIIVYCEQGVRAGIAQDALRKAGFSSILHLEGDMEAWRDSPSLPKGHRIHNRVCIYRPTNQNHL